MVFPKESRWIAPMFGLKHLRIEVGSYLKSYKYLDGVCFFT